MIAEKKSAEPAVEARVFDITSMLVYLCREAVEKREFIHNIKKSKSKFEENLR